MSVARDGNAYLHTRVDLGNTITILDMSIG